jgi:hypothetical protein
VVAPQAPVIATAAAADTTVSRAEDAQPAVSGASAAAGDTAALGTDSSSTSSRNDESTAS